MEEYRPHEHTGNMMKVLEAIPVKQAVAAAIDCIESWRLTADEINYLQVVMAHKQSSRHKPRVDGELPDISYNDCDNEFEKGAKKAGFDAIRRVVEAL